MLIIINKNNGHLSMHAIANTRPPSRAEQAPLTACQLNTWLCTVCNACIHDAPRGQTTALLVTVMRDYSPPTKFTQNL